MFFYEFIQLLVCHLFPYNDVVFQYSHDDNSEDSVDIMGRTGKMVDMDDMGDKDDKDDDKDFDMDYGIVLSYHHLNNYSYQSSFHDPYAFPSLGVASYGTYACMDMHALAPSYMAFPYGGLYNGLYSGLYGGLYDGDGDDGRWIHDGLDYHCLILR